MRRCFSGALFTALMLFALVVPVQAQQYCDATGDVDGDGQPLTGTDFRILVQALNKDGAIPSDAYLSDINGDWVVDTNDVLVFLDYYENGLAAFNNCGGYPCSTDCSFPTYDTITAHCIGYAYANVDGDSVNLSVGDLSYLQRMLNGEVGPANDLYQSDFNADGIVDAEDYQILHDFFIDGMSVFAPYGGYPVSNYCDPLLVLNTDRCCTGFTGDLDGNGGADMGDLTILIDHLFNTFEPLDCPAAGNVDGSLSCSVDMGDLTRLIDHLFITFAPTELCRLPCE